MDFEPDYLQRRYDTRGHSYTVPVDPFLGECLEDLLARAACENGFHPIMSYKLLGLSRDRCIQRVPGLNRNNITAEALSIVLGNRGGPDELVHLLHNTSPPKKYKSPFFDLWLDTNILTKGRRISPRALRQAPYLRLIWRVLPLVFDPETKEMLLTSCPAPECGKPLEFGFMGDIWCCSRCAQIDPDGVLHAVDLRDYDQPLVDAQLWEGLDFATSFIDPTALDRRAASRAKLHDDFANMGDDEVFTHICALARAMVVPDSRRYNKMRIEPDALEAAAQVVLGWPDAFEDKFVGNRWKSSATSRHPVSTLHYNTRLNVDIRNRMKNILRSSAILTSFRSLTPDFAKETAGNHRNFASMRLWTLKEGVETTSAEHSEAILLRTHQDINQAVLRLGISVPSVMALRDEGFFPEDFFSGDTIEVLNYERTLSNCLRIKSRGPGFPLSAICLPRAVAALFNRVDDPWPIIFAAMISGSLEYWLRDRGSIDAGIPLIHRLFVNDMDSLWEILSTTPRTNRRLYTIPLSKHEAKNISWLQEACPAVFRQLEIAPPFTIQTLAEFRSRFEISTLLSARHRCRKHRFSIRGFRAELLRAGIEPLQTSVSSMIMWAMEDVERHFGPNLMPVIS